MIPVKVQCECGQKYSFEVEPVNGLMPSLVTCPSCGVDGTVAANAIIAQQLAIKAANASFQITVPPRPVALQTEIAPPPVAPVPKRNSISAVQAMQMGLVDRQQAEHEARAKVSWGDSREDVIKYLMIQQYNVHEASELVDNLLKARAVEVRKRGIRQIFIGIGMMCVPVITFIFFTIIKIMFMKVMGLAIGVGLWGAWKCINGSIMVVVPKMEQGDVADK